MVTNLHNFDFGDYEESYQRNYINSYDLCKSYESIFICDFIMR